MKKTARLLLIACTTVIVLPLTVFVVREVWRAHTLLAFCKEARVGMAFADLLSLERRYWIDDTYLVQAIFDGYIDQAHSKNLEFRSVMYDPDFACAIDHDGQTVKDVQLLTLEGFNAD